MLHVIVGGLKRQNAGLCEENIETESVGRTALKVVE